mmetsp:Transcript_10163/g.13988  ORF Transcript_10163/g.13988 Transcript_10163/m.13988 type:complete len:224 (+) Transcript_10163:526-1197(+)
MYLTKSDNVKPLKRLSVRMYNSDISNNYMPTPFNNGSSFCEVAMNKSSNQMSNQCFNVGEQSSIMKSIPNYLNYPVKGASLRNIYDMSKYLFDHRNNYESAQFGAISFLSDSFKNQNKTISSISYVVYANYTAVHSAPLFASIFTSALTRYINPTATVSVSMHPLPNTKQENVISNNFNVTILSLFLLLAISVIPAFFATHIVREREVKAKHLWGFIPDLLDI